MLAIVCASPIHACMWLSTVVSSYNKFTCRKETVHFPFNGRISGLERKGRRDFYVKTQQMYHPKLESNALVKSVHGVVLFRTPPMHVYYNYLQLLQKLKNGYFTYAAGAENIGRIQSKS